MTYELELTTDGTEKVNQIGPFAHNSRTRVEGNKMTTEFIASNDAGKVDGQWIRTLSPDGKEMTLQVLTNASDGRKLDQTLVFQAEVESSRSASTRRPGLRDPSCGRER